MLICIPIHRGFLYLVTIMGWATRHVSAWRASNTMDARFCAEALNEALARYCRAEILNTDQGSKFTSCDFTGALKGAGIAITMGSRSRCMDNIFIERLWRSMKYEEVYFHKPLMSQISNFIMDVLGEVGGSPRLPDAVAGAEG